MIRLIVNADDFGLTEKINQAVVEAHREGIVTSTTLMANGLAFESAVDLARREPALGVGIHLNLSEGKPISGPASVPTLVDGRGVFCLSPVKLAGRWIGGKVNPAHVETELRAQIERVLCAGMRATHLDGHKHIHLFPPVFDILVRLAEDYGIRGVRLVKEQAIHGIRLACRNKSAALVILKQRVTGLALSFFSQFMGKRLHCAGLRTTDRFYGVTPTGFLNVKHLKEIVTSLGAGTNELMCHPGYVDAQLLQTPTRLLEEREMELQALIHPEVRQLVRQRSIELIHYGNLE